MDGPALRAKLPELHGRLVKHASNPPPSQWRELRFLMASFPHCLHRLDHAGPKDQAHAVEEVRAFIERAERLARQLDAQAGNESPEA